MTRFRKSVAVAVAVALLSTTATPAFARWGGGSYVSSGYGWGGGYRGHRRHRHNRVDAGDVIGAVAVVGIIAAIASASSKNKDGRVSKNRYPETGNAITSENAAVDACAEAAETRAGRHASVREISRVDRDQDGWDVEGVVEQRDDWRDGEAERRRFTCSVRFGEIDNFSIDTGTRG